MPLSNDLSAAVPAFARRRIDTGGDCWRGCRERRKLS